MLSAFLYKFRKELLKSPIKLILGLLAVGMSVGMLCFPMLFEGTEDAVVRNLNTVSGGVLIVSFLFFAFMFYSGLNSGVAGFSMADVNFHMAGPFSPRFNLIIAAQGGIAMCLVMIWVLSCQAAVLYQSFGLNTVDMIANLVTAFFVSVIGYFAGAYICAKLDNKDKIKKTVIALFFLSLGVFVGLFVVELSSLAGGFGKIPSLGVSNILMQIGESNILYLYPVAGWAAMIYHGILTGSIIKTAVGSLLVLLSVAILVYFYVSGDIEYYETAIANAQKVADLREASKAGVDTDTSRMNAKTKVGKETYKSGWGASALATRHMFENQRASKLFFVNSLGMLYRVITGIYIFIMTRGDDGSDSVYVITMGLTMMTMLNAIVYGGGKTVLEFNKPYIFLIPEKASAKLLNCLLADLPEIIFDSFLCAAIIGYFSKGGVAIFFGTFLFMIVFDYLCELVALIQIRIMRKLGRVLLIMVRYFIIYVLVLVTIIPGFIIFDSNLGMGLVFSAALSAVFVLILLACSRNVIDKVEFNS